MAALGVFLWALLIAAIAAEDSCPDPESISPCTCDEEGLACLGPKTPEEVKRVFKAKFKYGRVRSIWIQATSLQDIPIDIFGNILTHRYNLEANKITSVDFNAFRASKKTLQGISLFGNKLSELDYSPLERYENLNFLNLANNEITSIPDNAIKSKSLYEIYFAQNKISHIGENAFANLPRLGKLDLYANKLTTLGPMTLAMKTHDSALMINLMGNYLKEISPTAFEGTSPKYLLFHSNVLTSLPAKPFSRLITEIGQKGGFMDVSDNQFTCKGCDYSWIVLNKEVLKDKIQGFVCKKDRRPLTELTKSAIECM